MKRWFYKDHFFPRDIEKVPSWIRYPESHRKVYQFLCWHSWLTKHSPTRRYSVWTYQQIADHVGLSRVQVKRIMKRLMEDYLIYRWYPGDSGTTTSTGRPRPPRYEIPASKWMINWWRRVRKILQVKYHHRKEVINHAGSKKDRPATGVHTAPKERNVVRHPRTGYVPGVRRKRYDDN